MIYYKVSLASSVTHYNAQIVFTESRLVIKSGRLLVEYIQYMYCIVIHNHFAITVTTSINIGMIGSALPLGSLAFDWPRNKYKNDLCSYCKGRNFQYEQYLCLSDNALINSLICSNDIRQNLCSFAIFVEGFVVSSPFFDSS